MLKAFCDSCEQEIDDEGFFFQVNHVEVKKNLDGEKTQVKKELHSCKDCYEVKLKGVFYGEDQTS